MGINPFPPGLHGDVSSVMPRIEGEEGSKGGRGGGRFHSEKKTQKKQWAASTFQGCKVSSHSDNLCFSTYDVVKERGWSVCLKEQHRGVRLSVPWLFNSHEQLDIFGLEICVCVSL